jgi:hypothetical protein
MSLCRLERVIVPMAYWGLVLNPRWVQDLNRDVSCFKSMPDITLPNPPVLQSIKMMLFDPEVGPSIKWGNVAGRQGGGREINE